MCFRFDFFECELLCKASLATTRKSQCYFLHTVLMLQDYKGKIQHYDIFNKYNVTKFYPIKLMTIFLLLKCSNSCK